MQWLSNRRHRTWVALALLALALLIFGGNLWRAGRYIAARIAPYGDPRDAAFNLWWSGSDEDRQRLITSRSKVCPGAPFLLPARGYIGLLYADPRSPYTEWHRHQGIDIFSPTDVGITPVYAAYDGYLTRETGWTSALIVRIPDDPLNPGRQIWLYYTHMADASGNIDFIDDSYPQDTHDVFVKQGAFLGYTGNFSGNPGYPVGVHLHFSIVLDNGQGKYRNELDFNNTVDSSRYLGMRVNYACAPVVPDCDPDPLCDNAIHGDGGS